MSDEERRLLTLMTDTTEIVRVVDAGLRGDAFEEPISRAAYEFSVAYWQENQKAPTAYVIESELPGLKIGDPVDESALWLADRLRRRYVVRQAQEIVRNAVESLDEDPFEALRALHREAYAVSEAVAPKVNRSDMLDFDERRRRYMHREDRPQGIGLPFGVRELTEHTGGLMPGELAVLGAHPKVGKTFLLSQTAVQLRRAGFVPIFFTLEMSIKEIEDRIDALWSGVGYDRLIHARLNFNEHKTYRDGQEALAEMGGILVESPDPGDRTVASMITRARQAGADFVIIDQLSHMEPGHKTIGLKEHHGSILKQLSNELSRPGKEIPCLLAAQFRRPDKDQSPSSIGIEHFANAAEIEREADILLGLTRTKEERLNNVTRLHILAARRSDPRRWLLDWRLTNETRIEALEEMKD